MARQRSYGQLLHDAREKRGLDLNTAARRLRIRPDILRAIEEADFARLPPRGYTRNMISAYARLVGLNSSEITSMYLDEVHVFETGRARADERRAEAASSRRSGSGSSTRSTRSGSARGSSSGRTGSSTRTRSAFSSRTPRQGYVDGSSYPSLYSSNTPARTSGGGLAARWPFIAGAVVILIILIIVLVTVFGGNKNVEEDVPNVPISGLTDTSSPESESSASTVAVAPTSVQVTYKIADNTQVYAVITQDGTESQEMFSGGEEETVEVTGTWSFAAWASDGVTITVDGKTAEFDEFDASGMPMVSVNFEDILDDWYAEHGGSSSSAASSANSAASSSSRSSSSSSSSSASA